MGLCPTLLGYEQPCCCFLQDIFNFCKDKSRSLVTMSEKTMKDLFEDVNATMKKKVNIYGVF